MVLCKPPTSTCATPFLQAAGKHAYIHAKGPSGTKLWKKNHHIFLMLYNEQYLSVSSIKVPSLSCITLEEKEVNNEMLTDISAVLRILTSLIESNDLIDSQKLFKIQTLPHINESLKAFCYTLNA